MSVTPPVDKTWFVYIVRCVDNTFYTGATIDVTKRVEVHNSGKGAKYTKTRRPVTLEYSKEIGTKSEAMREEYLIKKLLRSEKEELIKGTLLESGESLFYYIYGYTRRD